MKISPVVRLLAVSLLVVSFAGTAPAAVCANKFLSRSEGVRKVVTLLTGHLTFQEAQALAKAIEAKEAPPLEWLDANGKTIAKQYGELKIVRPMPVGCDGKSSGVVMIATFPTQIAPSKKMTVKFNAATTVTFDEQSGQ
ncbi:MAG TPA: hypothetical protein VFN10_10650 [Thermoanaerobaculia bacterium]|nr:hypothetical protein [Thermoanaerobaculia bacterium]